MRYSIITAVYNGRKYIERLANSIFSQSYPNIEWIVQDGGSTDGTRELLEQLGNRVRFVSEKDSGVYDAWNRALERVTGEWVLFLGVDDALLHAHTLAQCHRHIKKLPETVQFVYGALAQGTDGKVDNLYNRSLRESYHAFLNNMGIPFPATFVRSELLCKEKFDTSFKIAGDYDLAARCITQENLVRIPVIVSYMERGGISENMKNCTLLEERLKVLFTRVYPKAQEFMLGCAENIMTADEHYLESA